jgi:3-hydroxyacyl-CoA dehydrogenase
MPRGETLRITLIGAGTIGLSFAALHLNQADDVEVVVFDTRPDIEKYIYDTLPGQYLSR